MANANAPPIRNGANRPSNVYTPYQIDLILIPAIITATVKTIRNSRLRIVFLSSFNLSTPIFGLHPRRKTEHFSVSQTGTVFQSCRCLNSYRLNIVYHLFYCKYTEFFINNCYKAIIFTQTCSHGHDILCTPFIRTHDPVPVSEL